MGEETTQNLPQDGVRLILSRLDSMEARLTALEDKVDQRLYDTRPMWEQVLVRLDAVEGRVDGFGKRLDDFGLELRSSLRRFERSVAEMAKDVLEVRGYQRDVEARMDKLESKAT